MEIKTFERAQDILGATKRLKTILRQHSNNPKFFRGDMTIPTEHMQDELLELINSTVEKLEKELAEL